ncbi:MAG: glycosyltransferase [Candidatus Latescibacterota bacterium]|nr:MAG: glycosyltransferase [Candidatus Latescibacterota bacterium]
MGGVVSVVIVNYGTADLTIEAVRSALAESCVHEVVVADNPLPNVQEPSPALRRLEAEERRVQLLELADNRGFGAGVNAAARVGTAPYLFALNSDATLQAEALGRLVSLLEADARVGLAAPPVYLRDGATLQPDACGLFPTPARLFTRATKSVCRDETPDWLSGVALLARRDEFLDLGGFDESFFMYYEDVELCHRYRQQLGKGCRRFAQGPGVVHLGGASRESSLQSVYDAAQDYYLKKVGFSPVSRLLVRTARRFYARFSRGREEAS